MHPSIHQIALVKPLRKFKGFLRILQRKGNSLSAIFCKRIDPGRVIPTTLYLALSEKSRGQHLFFPIVGPYHSPYFSLVPGPGKIFQHRLRAKGETPGSRPERIGRPDVTVLTGKEQFLVVRHRGIIGKK